MNKPASCEGCPLHTIGRGFAHPEGKGTKRLLVVSDFLGANEVRESLPLRPHGQAGSVFERALMGLRMKRDDVVIHSIVNCQPPGEILDGAGYKYGAISHCQPNLARVVKEFKPTAILALGGTALEALTGMKGKKKGINSLRGYVLWSETYKLPVVATYHPSYIARGQKNLLGVFYHDMYKAVQLAQGKLVEGKDYYLNPQRDYPNEYNLNPTEAQIADCYNIFLANPMFPLAFDIETQDSIKEDNEDDIEQVSMELTQFQVSHKKGQALVLAPHLRSFWGWVEKFMALSNVKLGWNSWRFDQVVLGSFEVPVVEPHLDLMCLWHHIEPDVPAGLQYAASFMNFPFPWKHLAGESLDFYGAIDVDVLHWLYPVLIERADKDKILGVEKGKFYEVLKITS